MSSNIFNVTPLGYGTWPLSGTGRPSESEAIHLILSALDLGINFIDTADSYCLNDSEMGYCERLVAKALKGQGSTKNVVIATKGGCTRPHGAWGTNGHPSYLKKACEASLKALNVSYIELYQLHSPDPAVPFEDTIGALADLKKEGKIRHLGLSNVELNEIKKAQTITNIISVQNHCNIFDLSSFKNGVINYCEQENLLFIPYSPLGGMLEKENLSKSSILLKISKELHGTPFQVALAWLMAKSPSMLPIPATTNLEHLKSNMEALKITLSPSQMNDIDKSLGV